VEACPDEEILVVIDDENVYGQNFFVCYTTEVKEQELAKYATAVSASPDGAVVGEEGAAVEEEKEDEVPPPSNNPHRFCALNSIFATGSARTTAASSLGGSRQRSAS
jgi:hypothetical protein